MPKPKRGYGFIQWWIVNCLWYNGTEGPIVIVYGIKWWCEGHKVFRAMHSEGKPMAGPVSIEKTTSVYDEMKITEMYAFDKGWLQNLCTVW